MHKIITPLLVVGALAACSNSDAPDLHTHFIDDEGAYPLVVLLGGSDGGNYFATPQAHDLLSEYHNYGFSVAAMGYFGTENTPGRPIELSLNTINQRIVELTRNPAVNQDCVVLLGFSKGAELALLLGSHFDSAKSVVAAYPSHVSWNAVKSPRSHAGWTLNDEPLDYIDAPLLSLPMLSGMVTGTYVQAFARPLHNASAQTIDAARIPVENIQGPVVLVSGKQDEIWPSQQMGKEIEQRLTDHLFNYDVLHIELEGGHFSYDRQTMDQVLRFLQRSLADECFAS